MKNRGILWAFGAIFFWSQSSVCVKIALHNVHWLTIAFWTSLFSSIFYFITILATKRLPRLREITLKQGALLAGIGVSGYFFYTCFMLAAYAHGPASEVLIVNYLWPIATVAFAALLSRERLGIREICGLLLALLGVICVVTRGQFHLPTAFYADILALCGAVFYGLYSAASKWISGDRLISLFIAYASSTVLFFISLLYSHGSFHIANTPTLLLIVYYGIGVGAIPGLFWLKALAAQTTTHAAILIYLTPALGLVWLTLFIPNEKITPIILLGFLFIVIGFLVQFTRMRTNHHTELG